MHGSAATPEELELLELELEELLLVEDLPLLLDEEDELEERAAGAGNQGTTAGIKLLIFVASVFKLPAASAPSVRVRSTPQAVPAHVLSVGLENMGN